MSASRKGQSVTNHRRAKSLRLVLYWGAACLIITGMIYLWRTPQPAWTQGLGTPHFFPSILSGWPKATATPLPGYLLITEVLYDSSEPEPDGEWIELYNAGGTPVDLSGFKIGDEETLGGSEGMFRFPVGVSLSPGDVLVVANLAVSFYANHARLPDFELRESHPNIPNLEKYTAWSGGNVELSNGGDEVVLLDNADHQVDGVSWAGSSAILEPPVQAVAESHSLERSPAYQDTDRAADWIDQEQPSPGQVDLSIFTPTPTDVGITITPPGLPTLLLSEVLYNPQGVSEPDGEWMEIYNFGTSSVNLGGIKLGDEESLGQGEGMLLFPDGAAIAAQGVVVVANRSATFNNVYGFSPDYEIMDSDPLVPEMLRYTAWSHGALNLGNNADEVLLLDYQDQLVDAISWGGSSVFLDPSLALAPEGYSFERYPPGTDTDSAVDWREQPAPDPAQVDLTPPTPTPSPSLTPSPTPAPTLVINEILADPHDVFGDANGDGIVDAQQDEFIEIVNASGAAVDHSGWSLWDTLGVRHTFPAGTAVGDQCAIIVFGGGTPPGSFGGSLVQIASSGILGLNNDGDTISVMTPGSVIFTDYSYGLEGGDDQSITRSPDITGGEPLIKHGAAPGSNNSLFSPGTRLDGLSFPGCGGNVWGDNPLEK